MRRLERISIAGFKSIEEQTLDLDSLNVLIGGNGTGKSNLIQAFRFLREIERGTLASYSLERGAESLLFFGLKRTKEIVFDLVFGEQDSSNGYRVQLVPSNEGTLVVGSEIVSFHNRTRHVKPFQRGINSGSREAVIGTINDRIAAYVRKDLASYYVYHFHDTSDSAASKQLGPVEDNRVLRQDAGNLAAFLYSLQKTQPGHFENIQSVIRQVAPFFDRFTLEPSKLSPDKIRIEWAQKSSDAYFNANALSDGTLRFICLATLLLQPDLPAIVLLDEPELGLHPAAIGLIAELLKAAAKRTQVIVSTQSVTLVNQFSPEQVWTVDREAGATVFHHLAKKDLTSWLERFEGCEGFSLGELWEKNVIGGRP